MDVLFALDIINGKEDGSYFAPTDNVTRGEMAKMIAVAMKGGNDVNTGTKGVPSFTDIAGHWAESYIEYCFDLGIIAGRGDGTYNGNYDTDATTEKGQIDVAGYDFPSDMGIENIGEEVMVAWKDGKDGQDGQPDKHDTIYGVFNTGKTQAFRTTFGAMQNAEDDVDDNKIKFGDVLHETTATVSVYYNYVKTGGNGTKLTAEQINKSAAPGVRIQSVDEIKFVCNVDGKIFKAYVTNYGIGRVTGVSASKISISNVGTINVADNDIYEGAAKDDVVVYTRFYNDDDKDKAFFTVTKATEVEGELTGFKFDKTYKNVVVDGTTYKVDTPAAALPSVTAEDAVTALSDTVKTTPSSGEAAIGDKVRLFMMGNMVGAVQSIENAGGKYAVVTEVSSGANDVINSNMNPLKVTVTLSDGTEQTLNVHKDSTFEEGGKSYKIKDKKVDHDAQVALFPGAVAGTGDLIEYTSISSGAIKIKRIIAAATVEGEADIWDQDSKTLRYGAGVNDKKVAATDAVIFVGVDKLNDEGKGSGKATDWYAYNLRSLSDIVNVYNGGGDEDTTITLSYIEDSKGLIKAAKLVRNNKAGSATADTLYGIVTGYVGTRQDKDNEDMWVYTVAVGREKDVNVAVLKETGKLSDGQIVKFDERSDGEYELGKDFYVLVGGEDGTGVFDDDDNPETPAVAVDEKIMAPSVENDKTELRLVAIRDYNESNHLLTYYTRYNKDDVESDWNVKSGSITTTNDVKLFFVNAKKDEQGDDIRVASFDAALGYANAILHINDKGVVDAIVIETSGKANLASVNEDKDNCVPTTNFGGIATYNASIAAGKNAITAVSDSNGAYELTISTGAPAKKSDLTVKVTTTGIDAANSKETVTVKYTVGGGAEQSQPLTFTSSKVTNSFTIKATGDIVITDLTVAGTPIDD